MNIFEKATSLDSLAERFWILQSNVLVKNVNKGKNDKKDKKEQNPAIITKKNGDKKD